MAEFGSITRREFIAIAGLGAFGLVGCSGQSDQTSDKQPDNAQNGAKASEDVELSTLVHRGLSMRYPEQWTRTDFDGGVYLYPDDGGMVMVSLAGEIDQTLDGLDDPKLQPSLDSFSDGIESSDGFTVGDFTTDYWDGKIAATAPMSYQELDGDVWICFCGKYVYMIMGCFEGDSSNRLSELIETVAIDPTAVTDGPAADESDTDASAETERQEGQSVGSGTHLVGTDIEAGEYRLTADAGDMGYWKVTASSAPNADIIGNDNFEGNAYVTVEDGQYLTLSRCTAERI